jgi:predicted PurR-regulated permease PerM
VPHARRPRAILIGDDILAKIGGYVLGNLVVSVIAAVLTFGWLLSLGVPYPFLLSVLVALLDLVPVVGSTVAGIIVAVALTVSLPTCLLTIGFFVVYRFFDDYVLVPKLIGKAVEVPALVTVVAVLIGRRPARRRRRPRRHPRRRRPGAHRQGDLVPPPR